MITAEEYFEIYQPVLDKTGKVSKIYDYYDLIDFAQRYHDSEMEKIKVEDK